MTPRSRWAALLVVLALAATTGSCSCTIDYGPPDPAGILITNATDQPARIVLVFDDGDETDLGTIEPQRTLDLGPGDLTREEADGGFERGNRLEARRSGAVVEEFAPLSGTNPKVDWIVDGEPDPRPEQGS